MDPVQVESAKQYDQTMYHWVNQSQLPMKELRSGLLSLIAEMFDGVVYDEDQVVWNPEKRGKLFRVLVSGTAGVGGAKRKTEVTDNAFDGRRWRFSESPACEIDEREAEEYDKRFPPREKKTLPCQEEFFIYSHSSMHP